MEGIVGSASRPRDRSPLRRLGAVLAEILAGLERPAMNRRVLHRLAAMSDRELRDIGLIRQDVRDAALPGLDAIALLRTRRDAARHRRRTP